MYLRDYNSLSLAGFYRGRRGCVTSTAPAVAPLRAGMLIEFTKRGVQPHSTYEGLNDRVFVQPGVEFSTTKDEYEIGELVPYIKAVGRAGVFVLLKGGQKVSRGDGLLSNGDGTVISEYAGTRHHRAIAAIALEDADVVEDTIIAARVQMRQDEIRYLTEPETLAPGEFD